MRKAGFAIVGISLLKVGLNGSIFLLAAVVLCSSMVIKYERRTSHQEERRDA
jgi:hypothetical protein